MKLKPTDQVVISGTGLWTPRESVSNEELVDSYNAYAERSNQKHKEGIAAGERDALPLSSADFIAKASGIRSRFVYCKEGMLEIDRMRPRIPERSENELSHQAEVATISARAALAAANKTEADIDAVIVSCAYTERAYPAIAIEVQHQLGIKGFGFDMLVACSAATFGLQRAVDMVHAGSARAVLVISPELITSQVNYRDRDSHFIFGDVSTAVVIERADTCQAESSFAILNSRAETVYSSNIRSNFGFLSRATDAAPYGTDKLFHQEGRKVFKEVCPMAARHMVEHLAENDLTPADLKRWWLHQANINMNTLIMRRILGRDAAPDEAPIILDRYANTASAGSVIAFHLFHDDFQAGEYGLLCSFGAGYSIGSLIVQRN